MGVPDLAEGVAAVVAVAVGVLGQGDEAGGPFFAHGFELAGEEERGVCCGRAGVLFGLADPEDAFGDDGAACWNGFVDEEAGA